MIYNLSKIAGIVSGTLFGSDCTGLRYFSVDSRTITSNDGTIFIALRGERHDAHRFIPDLIKAGIKAFLISDKSFIPEAIDNTGFVIVDNSLEAFQKLAGYHRKKLRSMVIGITGSNGKTIVKEWIYQALRKDKPVFRSPRSYNSQVGVPLSVMMIEDIYDLVVLEAGISMPGEMSRLEYIISPHIGIITNIGEAHQENFSSIEQKVREKILLFKNSKTIIYCRDHDLIDRELKRMYPSGKKLLCWGNHPESDFIIKEVIHNKSGTRIEIEGNISFNFQIPFHDRASLENALHFTLLLYELEYSAGFISKALLNLEPVAMRLEILKGIQSCTIISDTYNSDLVSLGNALDLLLQQNQHDRRTLILSDILQSGRTESDLYSKVSEMLKEKSVRKFIGIGPSLMNNRKFFPADSEFYPDTVGFLNSGSASAFSNEAILIKGARKFGFERITRQLQLRTHQTIMEVDLNAIVHNLNYYRSILRPKTKIMAMVKAFSYGSGSFEIANLLQYHKVDYLAVAFIDEGCELRMNGIRLPIMVMNPESGIFKTLVDNNLQPEIYSFDGLKELNTYLVSRGIVGYPVHVKLDTGMHRLGFISSEIDELARLLIESKAVKIESVFSHLAASDEPDQDDFSREQITQFRIMAERLKQLIGKDFIMHILNTSGVERFFSDQMDMIRIGIGLYGVSSFHPERLIEACTFKTTISQVRELVEGSTVGYGRKGIIKDKKLIATLPVGYADGLPRSLGNGKGHFLLGEKKVPVIGNICMDMCMTDITGTDARAGDEVIIFGKGNSVNEIARQAGTIPYEILTGISERVKRIYYHE